MTSGTENKLNVALSRNNYYRKSSSYNGATLWNSLSFVIRNTESLNVRSMTLFINARHSQKTAFSVTVYSLNFKYFSQYDVYFYRLMN